MARILGDVQELEDFKQKIEKQKKLKRKTLNAVKKYLPIGNVQFIECHPEFISGSYQPANEVEILKQVQHDRLINGRPICKNNLEKYEWLVQNEPQNEWLQNFKTTKEYEIYFGDEK